MMQYHDELPVRVRVLVLGGGIHGVGVLHDLASRGWRDAHLVEKCTVGFGTSSRSTKLIHGGLRYLRHMRDFGLVSESLRERRMLMTLAPDLVQPLELVFPILRHTGLPRWMIKAGLTLYDRLAGELGVAEHRLLSPAEISARAPLLDQAALTHAYSFHDAQTDDLGLVQRVAASARKLGATISEGCQVLRLVQTDQGWDASIRTPTGSVKTVSALYVINAGGPWANKILEASDIQPTHRAINNKGVHLLFDDLGLKAGLFLQSMQKDGRIFFLLPWCGYTLLGTTEELYEGDLDQPPVSRDEIDYLLTNCNHFLTRHLRAGDVRRVFAGLRWLAAESGTGLSELSRSHVLGELYGQRGLLITIYGGKLTTYRTLASAIGDRLTQHFGEFRPTMTDRVEAWVRAADAPPTIPVLQRFVEVS